MKQTATLIALCALSLSVSAQKWTLQQCFDHATQHNITAQKNRLQLDDIQEQQRQATAALFPSLSASVSQSVGYRPFQESISIVQNGMATTTNNKVTENGSYGLNANWTVWNGGINRKNVEAQALQYDIQEQQNALTIATLEEQIAQLYVQILYSVEATRVGEQLLATAEQQLQRGQERYRLGDLSKADLAQLEAQAASAKYDLVNSQTQVEGYKRQLKELLQLPLTDDFDVSATEIADERALAPVPDKAEVYAAALSVRPDIRAAELQTDAASLQLDIARRGYYPTLGLNAGLGSSHYAASGQDAFGTQLKRNLNGSVGVSVSVPIFDNRRNRTAVQRAKIAQTSAALDLQERQTALGSTIENLWLSATSAQQRFISASTAVASQEANYELINEQFKAGLKNIVDLLQARDNLLQAQQNKLQSKYTTILNTQLLHFYQGATLDI